MWTAEEAAKRSQHYQHEVMYIKIIVIYIVAFELWRWRSVKPIVKRWRKTETEDELLKNHETFFVLVGLGRVLEEIGIIAILIDVLFFIL